MVFVGDIIYNEINKGREDFIMRLSDKITYLRKSKGMSQEELASTLGVSRQAVSRWEMDATKPDANNILQISKLFGVTTDYLLNEEYESDDDLPKVKESNKILQTNLTLIAIIAQVSFLNAAMKPFQEIQTAEMAKTEFLIKIIPLLASSIWMAHNLRYEKDKEQYKKNVKVELRYCMIQSAIFLFGYFSKMYMLSTILLLAVVMIYIFIINPKYMNRQLTRKKK